ncbi:MAG TPA: hypothetical protein VF540_13070 [Segetibacter sp.]
MHLPINYIRHDQIDFTKWDFAISAARNNRIYAVSAFLNYMCDEKWDALSLGDYEYVMPLPFRKKFGIKYLYVPAFIQQLGIFSCNCIDEKLVTAFLKAIPQRFMYCDLVLNSNNPSAGYSAVSKKNYLLPLHDPYNVLQKKYSRSANRNIKTAIQEGVSIEERISPEITIQLHRQRFKDNIGATNEDYRKLKDLLFLLTKEERCISFAAKKNNTIIATSTYIIFKDRLVFLINGNTRRSLETGATHLLKDYVIHKFSNSAFTLDFEGSDFPSFARFYEQFGAKQIELYQHLIINRLPWPIKWLKRSKVSVSL